MSEKIYINTYAGLKDFFEGHFEIEFSKDLTLSEVSKKLAGINPESSRLLEKCRFAVNQVIHGAEKKVQPKDIIDILPPSSGG